MYLLLTEKPTKEGAETLKYLVNMEHVHLIWPAEDGGARLDYEDAQLEVTETFDQIAKWLSEGK